MNLPLFAREYAETDWERVMRIGQDTAQDMILRDLVRAQGSYLNGWRTWRGDWRKRVSELRQMGVPIMDRPDSTTRNQNEYSLPAVWIQQFFDRKMGRRK